MDVLNGAGSPRRGSINSLHRQSSGSLSHSSKTSGLQVNNNNLVNLHKDLDKFTRYFIVKTVQVIVQSRIKGNKGSKTECKPNGHDWFSINITDIPEVSDYTKAALDFEGFSIRSNWRVCCEISLQTNDGGRVVLEHWIISNKSSLNTSQGNLQSKLNCSTSNNQASPKSFNSNKSSHLSSSNTGIGPLSAINSTSTNRVGSTPFSSKMRTRLNSIDDCSGDSSISDKILVGTNNENLDIKSSTSCFSLTNLPANQATDQSATIAASPSSNSMSTNNAQAQSTISANNSTLQGYKTNSISSIYTIYNRMSLLLKTLMTTTHIVPAYRLASGTSSEDTCIICYRVYTVSPPFQNPKILSTGTKDSNEEFNHNAHSESPIKRLTSSSSSFGSVNIREFVGPEELDHFCPILKLGSIRTDVNELEISLCYRTDLKNSNYMLKAPNARNDYNRILDEDCITAAKQLLKGNEHLNSDGYNNSSPTRCGSGCVDGQDIDKIKVLNCVDQPLRPAFASRERLNEKNGQDSMTESAFDGLLQIKNSPVENELIKISPNIVSKPPKTPLNPQGRSTNVQSEPIQVPTPYRSKHGDLYQNLSSGSTPKSLSDSFVFVDLNPPFASEEQNDFNSFFHGPSPAFSSGFDTLKDVDELASQLAVIEANASLLDEFVDNICMSENEEEDK